MKKLKNPIEGYLASFFFIVLIILLTLQVFFRYVLNMNLSWSEEVSRYAYVWAVYFGFVLAANKQKHIRVTAHFIYLPEKVKKIFLTIADILWCLFNVVLVYEGYKYVVSMVEFPFYSMTTGINLLYVNLIVPVGFLLMTIRIIQNIIKRFKEDTEIVDSRKNI